MEPLWHILGREHRHVRRQRRVERLGGPPCRRATRHRDARDLPGRVHTGIGAACDREPVPASGVDDVEGIAKGSLDRSLSRLAGPAVETAAVVLECQPEGAHGRSF